MSAMSKETTQYDLVIVGGGLVGASLAIALSGRGADRPARSATCW